MLLLSWTWVDIYIFLIENKYWEITKSKRNKLENLYTGGGIAKAGFHSKSIKTLLNSKSLYGQSTKQTFINQKYYLEC